MKHITLLILFLFSASLISSDTDPYNNEYALVASDYYINFLYDSKNIIISPKDWTLNNYLILSALTTVTFVAYNNDEFISDIFKSNKNKTYDNIAFISEKLGNGMYVAGGLITSCLISNIIDNNKLRRTSLLAIESFVISGIFAQSFKHIIHRHRPYENDGPYEFDSPSLSNSSLSMPSGHSATVFSTAKIINECYSQNKILPYATYPLAFLAAISRIYDNQHWPSDVLLGSIIGYYTASIIIDSHKNKAFRFSFLPSKNNLILNLSYNF